MKLFISILIPSVFIISAFSQVYPFNCDPDNMPTADEQDTCMLAAAQNCQQVQAGFFGCNNVLSYIRNGSQVSCEDACTECLTCYGETGYGCCLYAGWDVNFQPCVDYCIYFSTK